MLNNNDDAYTCQQPERMNWRVSNNTKINPNYIVSHRTLVRTKRKNPHCNPHISNQVVSLSFPINLKKKIQIFIQFKLHINIVMLPLKKINNSIHREWKPLKLKTNKIQPNIFKTIWIVIMFSVKRLKEKSFPSQYFFFFGIKFFSNEQI